jgi:hypothetical protein
VIELLVLSACQTATGDKRAALGLAGVAVRAGALSTLASLWSVAEISSQLYVVSSNHNPVIVTLRRTPVIMYFFTKFNILTDKVAYFACKSPTSKKKDEDSFCLHLYSSS